MKLIFWTCVNDDLKGFIESNIQLQAISKQYPVIFAVSGTETINLIQSKYQDPIILHSVEDNLQAKGFRTIAWIKDNFSIYYDYIIRTDIDSLIFKLADLTSLIGKVIPNKFMRVVMGNPPVFDHESHIRGACQVMSMGLLQVIKMQASGNPMAWDEVFTTCAVNSGATLYPKEVFELGPHYTNNAPVWHPPRVPLEERLAIFNQAILDVFSNTVY
jgi:hypothetical protein